MQRLCAEQYNRSQISLITWPEKGEMTDRRKVDLVEISYLKSNSLFKNMEVNKIMIKYENILTLCLP